MTEPVVCSGCKQPAAWDPRVWSWVCPAGEVVSDQTGRIIGHLVDRHGEPIQPTSAWRLVGQPWFEDEEAPADG